LVQYEARLGRKSDRASVVYREVAVWLSDREGEREAKYRTEI
jgi:hypothetical protein